MKIILATVSDHNEIKQNVTKNTKPLKINNKKKIFIILWELK